MKRWPQLAGGLFGILAALCLLNLAGGGERKVPPRGPALSECSGHLRELVIHYEPSAREMVLPVYRQFISALESDITVHVVCPHQFAFEELRKSLGMCRCRLKPIVVNHPMTTWSRDRWLALEPAMPGSRATLWSPRGEAAAQIWPPRAGDERVAMDIANNLSGKLFANRSRLYFDAGDFFADDRNVFVMTRVLRRNLQQTVASREALIETVAAELKRPVILLDEAPDHHAAMFMVSVGNKTMLVGDPALARKSLPSGWAGPVGEPGAESWQADFSEETQRLFDAVASQGAAAGYEVRRIPTIPGTDGKSYLTYVNVLMDYQGKRRIVYLPFYEGAEELNAAARQVWEALGFEVRPIDCTTTFRHFGCLHCLVNVLTRSP